VTFSRRILIGLAAGIALGLFLGELVAPLEIVADGFVKLLQMTVLPYVTVSIISSLGVLDYEDARRLARRAGGVLLVLWAVALVYAFVLPLAFPSIETASFFSTMLLEKPPPFDFVDLYIPANPFHSLANALVPAVVLFSVIVGIALIGVERKQQLLEPLAVAGQAISRATRFVVRLMPYGIFAIAAAAAGTLDIEEVQRIQVYLIAYVAVALLVALWVLPGLVAALTPIPHREVIGPTRDALITAFMAGDYFIVLPILIESCRDLLARHQLTDEHSAALPDIVVPASFNFPHTGKLLSLSFILFAGWFTDSVIPFVEYPQLAATGLLTFFGSLNAAVPFLLDVFRIPADSFQLFLATGVINSRFGSLVAAVHTIAIGLLGSAAIVGGLRYDVSRLARFAVVTVVLTAVMIGGLRTLFTSMLSEGFHGEELVYGMTTLEEGSPPRVLEAMPAPDESGQGASVVERIQSRGTLRAALAAERLPYVFTNREGKLVGFDVELIRQLAEDLGVGLEFILVPHGQALSGPNAGTADLAAGGIALTPQLALESRVSAPYFEETGAFLVKDELRARFESWESIRQIRDLKVAVPPVPYYVKEVRERAPNLQFSEIQELTEVGDPLDAGFGFDALLYPAERGSILTLLNPEWSVIVPEPEPVKVPIVLSLPRYDERWARFVSDWIGMKRGDGTIRRLYEHYILGQRVRQRQPRWSVIRNVLHWVE
jgi:Na+/H+-dicarboxylate symporter/ABC-type amino acid transport substrate-binding protein